MVRLFAILILFAAAATAQQSLGDAARAARTQKPRTTTNKPTITNESLSMMGGTMTTATVSNGASADSAKPSDASKPADATKPADTAAGAAKPADDKDEAAKKEDQKKQLADDMAKAQADLTQLSRELDVLQRENRMRAATYYADAGNRLRNEQQYAAADRQYQADIQAKQQAISAAQAKLEGLRDQARRLGVPGS